MEPRIIGELAALIAFVPSKDTSHRRGQCHLLLILKDKACINVSPLKSYLRSRMDPPNDSTPKTDRDTSRILGRLGDHRKQLQMKSCRIRQELSDFRISSLEHEDT